MSKNDAFYVEEYKSLRDDISIKLKDRNEFSRWGLIGLAALYSYILANPGRPILFWVPVFLSLTMLAHLNEEHRMIGKMGTYIREQFEPWAAGINKHPEGWETYLGSQKTARWWIFWRRWPLPIWDWAPVPLWVSVFALTLVIAVTVSAGLWSSVIAPPVNCAG